MVTIKELSFQEMQNLMGGIADPDAYGITCWTFAGGTEYFNMTDGAFLLNVVFRNKESISTFQDTYAACELGGNL
jgi:hypothetical protein